MNDGVRHLRLRYCDLDSYFASVFSAYCISLACLSVSQCLRVSPEYHRTGVSLAVYTCSRPHLRTRLNDGVLCTESSTSPSQRLRDDRSHVLHFILTVTAVECERSPQSGGKRYVTVLVLRIRFLPFPASHPLAKLAIFFRRSLTATNQRQSLPSGRTAGCSSILSFS